MHARLLVLVCAVASQVGCHWFPEEEEDAQFQASENARALPRLEGARTPPPPISGGTLAVSVDGRMAVAADPDRDAVYVVDLEGWRVQHTVDVPGQAPGRVVISGRHAYVSTRRGGTVLLVNMDSGQLWPAEVCPAPRGLAVDRGRVHVACAGGDLVTLGVSGRVERRVFLASDLRDVVIVAGTPGGVTGAHL